MFVISETKLFMKANPMSVSQLAASEHFYYKYVTNTQNVMSVLGNRTANACAEIQTVAICFTRAFSYWLGCALCLEWTTSSCIFLVYLGDI
jgi:hypothetical protein